MWRVKRRSWTMREEYLLENLKGERTPDWSLAAHPKACFGCSSSGNLASIFLYKNTTVRSRFWLPDQYALNTSTVKFACGCIYSVQRLLG